MLINIQPTSQTLSLLKKLENSTKVVNDAKKAGMIKATNLFRARAIEKAPIRTGTLRKSILTDVSQDGESGRIYSDLDYALYQEEGTGIYGPKGSPITPKKAKYLRFKAKSGQIIYTKRVKGVKAKKFFANAGEYIQTQANAISDAIFSVLERSL